MPHVPFKMAGRSGLSMSLEQGTSVRRTEDNRQLGLILHKGLPGEHWRRLFRGDPDGARCMHAPYSISGDRHLCTPSNSVGISWIMPSSLVRSKICQTCSPVSYTHLTLPTIYSV